MTGRVRVPHRVAEHVLTSDAAHRPELDPLGAELVELLRAAPARVDGARHVVLDEDQAAALYEYAEALIDSARDNVAGEPSALADINAGRAALRALAARRAA